MLAICPEIIIFFQEVELPVEFLVDSTGARIYMDICWDRWRFLDSPNTRKQDLEW